MLTHFANGLEYLLLLAGLVLSYLFCWGVRKLSPKLKLVNQPSENRLSQESIPMGGGLGWLGAFLLIVAMGSWWVTHATLPEVLQVHRSGMMSKVLDFTWICGGAAVLMLLGLFDDIKPVPVMVKLLLEFGVAITLAFQVPDVLITAFVDNMMMNRVFTVMWIVVLVNSFNLLDHADGVSSVTGIAVFVGLAVLSLVSGQLFVGLISLLLVGVLLGFFLHNFPPAKLFMGDAGSLPLGYFVAVLTALFTFYSDTGEVTAVFVPLCLLLVPLYDSASVVLIRLKNKKPVWQGDKNHISHRLLAKGWSGRRVVLTMLLMTLIGSALSVSIYVLRSPLTYIPLALLVVLIFVVQRLERQS